MSPEVNIPTPEQQDERPYVLKARELAEAVSAQPEQATEARFQAVDSYVADILNAADAGEIGDYSRADLLDQFDAFRDLIGKSEEQRDGLDPFKLIPRANGLRDSFRLLEANEQTAIDLRLSLELNARGNETVSTEPLPELRSELITSDVVKREMGGASLKAVGIEQPQATSEQVLVESTPEESETEVEMYERFVREGKEELDELYRQHRGAEVGSNEWASLENQIKLAKEDIGANARRAAQLKGNRWT